MIIVKTLIFILFSLTTFAKTNCDILVIGSLRNDYGIDTYLTIPVSMIQDEIFHSLSINNFEIAYQEGTRFVFAITELKKYGTVYHLIDTKKINSSARGTYNKVTQIIFDDLKKHMLGAKNSNENALYVLRNQLGAATFIGAVKGGANNITPSSAIINKTLKFLPQCY